MIFNFFLITYIDKTLTDLRETFFFYYYFEHMVSKDLFCRIESLFFFIVWFLHLLGVFYCRGKKKKSEIRRYHV